MIIFLLWSRLELKYAMRFQVSRYPGVVFKGLFILREEVIKITLLINLCLSFSRSVKNILVVFIYMEDSKKEWIYSKTIEALEWLYNFTILASIVSGVNPINQWEEFYTYALSAGPIFMLTKHLIRYYVNRKFPAYIYFL